MITFISQAASPKQSAGSSIGDYLLVPFDGDLSPAVAKDQQVNCPTMEISSFWEIRQVADTDPAAATGYALSSRGSTQDSLMGINSQFQVSPDFTNLAQLPGNMFDRQATTHRGFSKKYHAVFAVLPVRQPRDWVNHNLDELSDLRETVTTTGTCMLLLTDDTNEIEEINLVKRIVRAANATGSKEHPPLVGSLYQLTYQGQLLKLFAAVLDAGPKKYRTRKPRPPRPATPSPLLLHELISAVHGLFRLIHRYQFNRALEDCGDSRNGCSQLLDILGLMQLTPPRKHAYRQTYEYWALMWQSSRNLPGTIRKFAAHGKFVSWLQGETSQPSFQRNLRRATKLWGGFKGYSNCLGTTLNGKPLQTRSPNL